MDTLAHIFVFAIVFIQSIQAQRPPAGRLVYHRYSSYEEGDSEMFVVSFPSGIVSQELGTQYGLCNPMNGIWSPDGKRLALMAQPKTGQGPCPATARSKFDIYVLDMTKPGSYQLATVNDVPDEDPQFFPSGSHLIFKHNDHIALWKVGSRPFTTCDDLKDGSFCFKSTGNEQSKPVVTPDEKRVCYWEGSRNDADVYCFDLAPALNGTNIDSLRIPVAANKDVEDYFPVIDQNNIYYARGRSANNNANVIERKPLKKLEGKPTRAKFCTKTSKDYSDPCSVGGNVLIFSTTDSSGDDYDLFIAKFFSTQKRNLDDFSAGLNSPKWELGANFIPN